MIASTVVVLWCVLILVPYFCSGVHRHAFEEAYWQTRPYSPRGTFADIYGRIGFTLYDLSWSGGPLVYGAFVGALSVVCCGVFLAFSAQTAFQRASLAISIVALAVLAFFSMNPFVHVWMAD